MPARQGEEPEPVVKPQAKSAARLADKYLAPRFTRGLAKPDRLLVNLRRLLKETTELAD
jgi:phage gp36-like protein